MAADSGSPDCANSSHQGNVQVPQQGSLRLPHLSAWSMHQPHSIHSQLPPHQMPQQQQPNLQSPQLTQQYVQQQQLQQQQQQKQQLQKQLRQQHHYGPTHGYGGISVGMLGGYPTLQPAQLKGLQPPAGLAVDASTLRLSAGVNSAFLGAVSSQPLSVGSSNLVGGSVLSGPPGPVMEASEYIASKDMEIERLGRQLAMLQQKVKEEHTRQQEDLSATVAQESSGVPCGEAAMRAQALSGTARFVELELRSLRKEIEQASEISMQLNTWFLENASKMRAQDHGTSPSAFLEVTSGVLRQHIEVVATQCEQMQDLLSKLVSKCGDSLDRDVPSETQVVAVSMVEIVAPPIISPHKRSATAGALMTYFVDQSQGGNLDDSQPAANTVYPVGAVHRVGYSQAKPEAQVTPDSNDRCFASVTASSSSIISEGALAPGGDGNALIGTTSPSASLLLCANVQRPRFSQNPALQNYGSITCDNENIFADDDSNLSFRPSSRRSDGDEYNTVRAAAWERNRSLGSNDSCSCTGGTPTPRLRPSYESFHIKDQPARETT